MERPPKPIMVKVMKGGFHLFSIFAFTRFRLIHQGLGKKVKEVYPKST
ncbi:hypothetical protein [uncultured Bacteroides sp.]|nr:hypothetical protein [uncultured Bacteroides sp.]